MKKISIIVPCYNEHETIETYYNEATKYLNDAYDFHIIFVNDGSRDNSLEIMKSLAARDKRVLYMSFSRNFGKEAAMYAGLECAEKINSDASIIMDVDLQDPPALIPQFLQEYENGYKLVYAKQRNRNGASKFKSFCSLSFYKVYAFLTKDKQMAQGARDFCLLDRKVMKAFLTIKDHDRFTKGIYHYVGFDKKCIEFDYVERTQGTTKWSFTKLLRYAFTGIREFSRVYEYIPYYFIFLTAIACLFNLVCGICWRCGADMSWLVPYWNPWLHFGISLGLLGIFFVMYYLIKMIYDIRSDVRQRPIYIEDETNVMDENESE